MCAVQAYRCDPISQTVDYNAQLSDSSGIDHCRAEGRQTTGPSLRDVRVRLLRPLGALQGVRKGSQAS